MAPPACAIVFRHACAAEPSWFDCATNQRPSTFRKWPPAPSEKAHSSCGRVWRRSWAFLLQSRKSKQTLLKMNDYIIKPSPHSVASRHRCASHPSFFHSIIYEIHLFQAPCTDCKRICSESRCAKEYTPERRNNNAEKPGKYIPRTRCLETIVLNVDHPLLLYFPDP